MDESVHITELEFDGSPYVVKPGNPAVLSYNLKPSLKATLMVIRHFEDEQVFKNVSAHRSGLVFTLIGCSRYQPQKAWKERQYFG